MRSAPFWKILAAAALTGAAGGCNTTPKQPIGKISELFGTPIVTQTNNPGDDQRNRELLTVAEYQKHFAALDNNNIANVALWALNETQNDRFLPPNVIIALYNTVENRRESQFVLLKDVINKFPRRERIDEEVRAMRILGNQEFVKRQILSGEKIPLETEMQNRLLNTILCRAAANIIIENLLAFLPYSDRIKSGLFTDYDVAGATYISGSTNAMCQQIFGDTGPLKIPRPVMVAVMDATMREWALSQMDTRDFSLYLMFGDLAESGKKIWDLDFENAATGSVLLKFEFKSFTDVPHDIYVVKKSNDAVEFTLFDPSANAADLKTKPATDDRFTLLYKEAVAMQSTGIQSKAIVNLAMQRQKTSLPAALSQIGRIDIPRYRIVEPEAIMVADPRTAERSR